MRVFLEMALNRPAQPKSAGSAVHEKTGRFARFLPVRRRGRSCALNKPAMSPVPVFSGSTAGPVRFLKLCLQPSLKKSTIVGHLGWNQIQ
jgi:hypothetical protein